MLSYCLPSSTGGAVSASEAQNPSPCPWEYLLLSREDGPNCMVQLDNQHMVDGKPSLYQMEVGSVLLHVFV